MLLGKGFELYKNNYTASAPLGNIENFMVTDGINAGELKQRAKRLKGSGSYVRQYTQRPITSESVWISFNSTKREFTFRNLESGKRYWHRIIAIGVKGQVSQSDPISRVPQ